MAKKKLWEKADFESLKNKVLTKEQLKLRHALRYACFRVQKEIIEGVECPDEYKSLVKPLESMDGFTNWRDFAATWDISTPDPIVIVERMWSIEQEHQQMLERSVKFISAK